LALSTLGDTRKAGSVVSRRTIERLSLYRRRLISLREADATFVYSHQIAKLAVVSAAQVRRDFMAIGYSGSPNRGYEVEKCLESIGAFLDAPTRQDVVLVGVGNLGRAVLAFFSGRRPTTAIVAAFDIDPKKIDTTIVGTRCFDISRIEEIIADLGAQVAIIAVPAEAAEEIADTLVRSGVRSIVNFAPVRLHLPEDVFVRDVDITAALEVAAFFARTTTVAQSGAEPAATEAPQPMVRELETLLTRAEMKLDDLAERIGATIVTPARCGREQITKIFAGDRVSDLLNQASATTLLVSNLASVQMLRIAELMEVPGICFVNGTEPDAEICTLARENGTMIMVSPIGVFETCGMLYQTLANEHDA
jgi:redox-sensing transcriptional repressor